MSQLASRRDRGTRDPLPYNNMDSLLVVEATCIVTEPAFEAERACRNYTDGKVRNCLFARCQRGQDHRARAIKEDVSRKVLYLERTP